MVQNNLDNLLVPLHLISLAKDYLSGKTRLQKLIFLSQKEFEGDFNFKFGKASLGPLSYKLLDTVNELEDLGLIKKQKELTDFGFRVFKYNITGEGKKLLEFGKEKSLLTSKTIKANEKVMENYGSMGHVDLLNYVHSEYPRYRSD